MNPLASGLTNSGTMGPISGGGGDAKSGDVNSRNQFGRGASFGSINFGTNPLTMCLIAGAVLVGVWMVTK